MKASWKNVGEQSKVSDLLERFVLVGELQQLEVGPGHHHVFGLTALPSAKVETIRPAVTKLLVRTEADIGMALLAICAGAARHIERHRADVAFLDILDSRPDLDNLTGVLVAHQHSRRSCKAPIVNVQVAAADVGGNEFQNDGMIDLPAFGIGKFGVSAITDLHLVCSHKHNGAIT